MKILIAEDDKVISRAYKIVLEERGHDVTITDDGEMCIKIYEEMQSSAPKKQNKVITKNKNPESIPKSHTPIDVVVLDYKMPKVDGMQVAKRILKIQPNQRIIFASAHVEETLKDSVKQLRKVIELLQKPFEPDVLVDTIEDQEAYDGLKSLITNIRDFDIQNPSHGQMETLFKGLRKIQKGRTF
ncbi:MAG TPA: response regulator [Candidatus Nitrosocosmicus sp.]|nr:response regulator [Candidatus Nitrosocosmicus sp.]